MAFKRTAPVFLLFFLLVGPVPLLLAENVQDDPPSALSEKNDAELIAGERKIKEKLQKEPSNAELYYQLSEIYSVLFDRTRKKNAQAKEWLWKSSEALERTVMIDPAHKAALYNLGVVYKRQGRMEKAREELRRAMRACDPNEDGYLLTAIWMQIGSVYEEQGFFDEAKESYEKALEYDYGNDEVRSALLDLKEKKAGAAARSASGYDVSPVMPMNMGPVARDYDPMSGADMQEQGLAQALPALGNMLAQKFSGGQGGQSDNEPAQ